MKFRIMILAAVLVLLPFAGAFAVDVISTSGQGAISDADIKQLPGGTFYGDVGGTMWVAGVSGSKAKFSEYRDMTSAMGFYDDVRLGYDSDNYWMKFKGTDMGYHTQDYQLDGGQYGMFKVNGFYNEIVHNTTFGALTPYSGVGTSQLSTSISAGGVPANTNPGNWNSFNYSIQRNQYGGGVRLDALNPFYVDFSMLREDRTGLLPYSNGGASFSSGAIEIPAPVNYTTDNYMGEIGYRAKPLFAALTYNYGDFTNANQILTIGGTGPITNSTASLMTLPPDNNFWKLGFKGVLQLPLNTRFNVNLSGQTQSSSFDLTPLLLFSNSLAAHTSQTVLSQNNFSGSKDIRNYAFSLTSNPVRFLDVKLFYKYYDVTNNSSQITQTTGTAAGTIVPLFGYKKDNYGVDLGFKLPENFRLNAGYSYIDTDRENRPDIPSTKDNIYSAELRWNGLDFLTPKIGYEHLAREAIQGAPYALQFNSTNFPQFTDFDAGTQRRDTYKIAADATPLDNLNIGFAYKYKKSDYPSTTLGVANADTNELETYGDYLIGGIVRLNAYFDLQYTKENIQDVVGSTTTVPSGFATPTATNYAWNTAINDNTYEFGAGADVYLVPKKLTLRVQYDYVNSDGTEDFGFFYPGAISGVNANSTTSPTGNPNLNDVDSYHKTSFMCKLKYAVSKSFTMAIGATFEQFKYNDYALSSPNYYYIGPGSTYLTGAYANPSYNASIAFLSASYKF